MTTPTLKKVKTAKIVDTPNFAKKKGKRNSAIVKGIAYENKIVRELCALYGEVAEVLCHPWIEYEAQNKSGICQPDAAIIPRNEKKPIVLIEVKLSWTSGARRKMTALYEKVLAFLYPGRKIRKVQVCKYINRRCKDKEFLRLDELLSTRLKAYQCVHWV